MAQLTVGRHGGAHGFPAKASPEFHLVPDRMRHCPTEGVSRTNVEVDDVAGLLSMREGHALSNSRHERPRDLLTQNLILIVSDPARAPEESFAPLSSDGADVWSVATAAASAIPHAFEALAA